MNKSSQSPKSKPIPPWVYWMPPLDSSEPRDEVGNWERQVVGVVKVRKGVTMDWEYHCLSLSERVQELLEKAPDPEWALDHLYDQLEKTDRSPENQPDLEEAGLGLIYHNPRLLPRIWNLVPMELFPVKVDRNDLEAQRVYEEADIDSIELALTSDIGSDHLL